MVALAGVIAGVATLGELADNIKKMTGLIPKAPTDLTDKNRWMTITMFNQTQFPVIFKETWFTSGRLWQSPTNVKPFSSMTFSVCSKDNSVLSGTAGGASFELQMPKQGGGYQTLDIAVGFSRPEVGAVKCSAIYGTSPEEAYNVANKDGTAHTSCQFSGTNRHGADVTLDFSTVASAGQEASVTITEQILEVALAP